VGVNTLFLIPGEVGGSERYLHEMLRALAEDRRGLDLTLFTQDENDAALRQRFGGFQNVRTRRLRCEARHRPRRILSEQIVLPFRARQAGVQVLWSPGYTAPLASGIKQVVTVFDVQYKRFPEDLSLSYRLASDLLIRAAVRRAERVVTLSRFGREEVVRYYGVQTETVTIVSAGCRPEFGDPMPLRRREEELAAAGVGSAPFVLCVAHSYPHKNLPLLIRAFARLGNPALRLVLVGQPRRGEAGVQAALRECGCSDRVLRLGAVAQERLVALYQGCAAFVLPSLYEGFGLPVLEAMMAGAPVVTTRAASLPEVGGEHVLYVGGDSATELARAMQQVLEWPVAARQARTEAARNHARSFTWETASERMAAVFRDVAGA
jgi:glycosyltransferase involved in cell wall biosynthesis